MTHAASSGARTRSRARTHLVVAAALTLLSPVDLLIVGHFSPGALLTRLAWSTQVAGYALLLERASERQARLLRALHGACAGPFYLLLTWYTGGTASPLFQFAPTVPLLVALVNPEDSSPGITSGVTTTLATLALVLGAHAPLSQALTWAIMTAAATFFGVYGSDQFRKVAHARNEARVERARRESLERLALAERHRAQSEKLATVGRLAASVMHEINNPLAFVRSNLEFLQREVLAQPLAAESRQEITEVLAETRAGVERIRQIVADLKGFSRMDEEEPGECALADVVQDAARLASLRLKHVARLQVEVPRELPTVHATPRRLAQVVLNLLVNAGDALEGARVVNGEVRVRGLREEGRVVLLVEDNGPGFPVEVQGRLFEAFFTTKGPEKGTGLGLAISRELVERFGGKLTAENRPEGGARLRLELPVQGAGAKG
jgi:C4-dicarboxylate-specific signal transduction histidine kinase